MPCIGHQPLAAEVPRKDALARSNRLLLVHAIEARLPPSRLRALDYESRRVGIELVGMHPNPAVLRLLEDECEGIVELLVRTEPDVLGVPNVDVRAEGMRQRAAHPGVGTVTCDNEVVSAIGFEALDLSLEAQFDAECLRACLQDVEEPFTADAAEAVSTRARNATAVVDGDIVPIDELPPNRPRAVGVSRLQVCKGFVGEHDTPTKGVVRAVALDHHDVVPRIAQLHGNREVEPGRPSAQTSDAHGGASAIQDMSLSLPER